MVFSIPAKSPSSSIDKSTPKLIGARAAACFGAIAETTDVCRYVSGWYAEGCNEKRAFGLLVANA